jgi:preprotein translocase subunit SecD
LSWRLNSFPGQEFLIIFLRSPNMSNKKKNLINIALILVLAFFAFNLCYPVYYNQGADYLNVKFGLKIPHFWNKPFILGLDLQGGAHLLYQADLSKIGEADKSGAMAGLKDVIERRVNLFGVSEPVVQVQGDRLVVELAGVLDVSEAIKMIGQTPLLEFREQKDNFDEINANNQKISEGTATGTLEDPFLATALTGQYLKSATVAFDQTTYQPMVSLQFNEEGAKLFEQITEKNVDKIIAIYIDNQLISAPKVNEKISGGKAQISGSFTVDEAKTLARNLNAGALPVPITLVSQQTVGPSLGKVSLEKSLKAGLYGLLAIILFMIILYRLPGIVASLALIIYVALVLAVFKLVPVTLTLAGIAGFLISIGMAVDANILIFARMKEELGQGKNLDTAVQEGFKRAWPSIRDSNFNTIIVTLILFGFATSFIKGFALTLLLGVLVSMFSAIVITRNFLRVFIGTWFEKINWLWK